MAARPVSSQAPSWLHPPLPRASALIVLLVILSCTSQGSESQGEEGGTSRVASPALLEPGRAEWPTLIPPASPLPEVGVPQAAVPEREAAPARSTGSPVHSGLAPSPPALDSSARVIPGLSLAFLPGPNAAAPPQEWRLQEFSGPARFRVAQVRGTGVVRLESEQTSFALHRNVEVDLAEFPYLTWTWRVDVLPEGGDVRRREADDQAAQLYVVFPRFPAMLRSRVLGYVWDATAPAGSSVVSATTSLARIVVVESGPAKTGRWIEETRNIREDYRRLFHEEPPRVGKVTLLINSQHTRSRAVAWFGPIRFAAEPPRRGAGPLQVTLAPHP